MLPPSGSLPTPGPRRPRKARARHQAPFRTRSVFEAFGPPFLSVARFDFPSRWHRFGFTENDAQAARYEYCCVRTIKCIFQGVRESKYSKGNKLAGSAQGLRESQDQKSG